MIYSFGGGFSKISLRIAQSSCLESLTLKWSPVVFLCAIERDGTDEVYFTLILDIGMIDGNLSTFKFVARI